MCFVVELIVVNVFFGRVDCDIYVFCGRVDCVTYVFCCRVDCYTICLFSYYDRICCLSNLSRVVNRTMVRNGPSWCVISLPWCVTGLG
jgi:hypothetical protein